MIASELLSKLTHLTLVGQENGELIFDGTSDQMLNAMEMETRLRLGYRLNYDV